eukprot:7056762-Heterocapsa_arctica.AAC.1
MACLRSLYNVVEKSTTRCIISEIRSPRATRPSERELPTFGHDHGPQAAARGSPCKRAQSVTPPVPWRTSSYQSCSTCCSSTSIWVAGCHIVGREGSCCCDEAERFESHS